MKKIKFLKSPTGKYGLAYVAGDVAEFEEKQANELIESGFATLFIEETNQEIPTETKPAEEAPKEIEKPVEEIPTETKTKAKKNN